MNRTLDVFIITADESDDDSEDDGTTDDDESDDTDNDTDDDNGSDDSKEGDDDSDDDNGSDDSNDDGGDDSDDDDGSDDSNDDDPTEDDETDTYYLSVNKYVWKQIEEAWTKDEYTSIGEQVQFKITVTYNGSNLSQIQIVDKLPVGLFYEGNATVNGTNIEPYVNEIDHTLQWNISAVSNKNTTITIEYNTSVVRRSTLQNHVRVDMIKNDTTTTVTQQDEATVYIFGDLNVTKKVRNMNETTWNETITAPLNGTVRFNITIDYNGTYSVKNINIFDQLPEGIDYLGNATLDTEDITLNTTDNNRTLRYNHSLLYPNEKINLEFDANISKNATIENIVQVWANETIGKQFKLNASSRVIGQAPQLFTCKKTVSLNHSEWTDSINAFVGDTATFNITINNLGMNVVTNLAILDTLPDELSYEMGSSIIYFENETYYPTPYINESTGQYLWQNLNEQIEDYFDPNDTLFLHYNVTILEEGRHLNQVKVSSSLCGTCDPLTGYDSATINATTEFKVDINIPEPVYVGEEVWITAQVSGGEQPYNYTWDIDDDGVFDDEDSSSFKTMWNSSGNYSVSVKVIDNLSEVRTDTVIVNVTVGPLTVDAGGPYHAEPGEIINFNGAASGGLGNYTWLWDLDDGNVSLIQNPAHSYSTFGVYYVTLNVTDARNVSAIDTAIVTIEEPDDTAPAITFESPIDAIYVRNKPVFPFFKPLVIGSIEINVTAEDEESTVESISIYINSKLVKSITGDSGNYTWDETVFGRQTLTVKAVNSEGIEGTEEKIVWKFF
ncbi:MAG: PKD domain-containing protein [Candidatus Thermoplasmatota archaeon]|nr:PKD domain-containing protein [Candidatus Thermoplasmatota archaeon]